MTLKEKRTYELLAPFMEEGRKSRIAEVIHRRTKGLVLVLENLYDPHNISAILRSAEAMGLQYVYLAGTYPEELNPDISLGSECWLTVKRKEKPIELVDRLKAKGYKVAATVPDEDGIDPLDYEGGEFPSGSVPSAAEINWAPASAAALAEVRALMWHDAPITVRIGPEGPWLPPVRLSGRNPPIAWISAKWGR